MKKNSSIPSFKNDIKAAEFFDSHDSVEYLTQTKPAHLAFPNPTHKIVIGLEEKQWQKLQKIASARKLPYTRILERLISKQLATSR